MMEDLVIQSFHSFSCSTFIVIDGVNRNAECPSVMDCRFGRSMHSNIEYYISTSNFKGTIIEIV